MRAIVGLALALAAAGGQAQEHGLGVWNMNREKSAFQPGPPPRSMTEIHDSIGQGIRTTIEGADARGQRFVVQFTAYFDGKEWPLTGSPLANTATFRRIDPSTVERIERMDGRPVQTVVRVISPDGREAMVIQKGAKWHNVIIFDKQ